jgi:cellulose synthase/poly-beta-1,6-N-acetylglucosamine synthase-like glycosyltransferase
MTTPELVAAWLFWISVGLVVYAYVGYPVLIYILSRLFGKPPTPPPAPEQWPTVSLLIAAYNEANHIQQRIENALAMDYPGDQLQIVIASDGSSDATCSIVEQYADRGVILFDYAERSGKPAVLNRSVPRLTGEIVAFSDANSYTEPAALKHLVRWFSDPQLGAVCGKLVLVDADTGQNVDSMYWKYETFLKKCESRLGGLLGSNGAIYALRRAWYPAIPDNTIVDDFVIPLRAKIVEGCKIVYDADAIATEETPAGIQDEFKRRSRIGAGGFQAIGLLWRLLSPRHGWTAFTFLNHKILRWICPFLLILALLTNLLLLNHVLYRWLLGAQVGFYLLAALGNVLPSQPKVLRTLRLATMFTSMNAALLVGFFRWLFGTQRATWHRTERQAEAQP